MSKLPVYRVALLSCAMHQPSIYAPAFAEHPRFEIACVADDPGQIDDYIISATQGVASEYGVP